MADADRIRFDHETKAPGISSGLSRPRRQSTASTLRRKFTKDIEASDYQPVESEERDYKHRQIFTGWTFAWLSYQSIGVIYGDIGTSPLYVYSSTFSSPPSYDDLLGALSLIIWTITLIVTVKYVFIVLCADDEGEGGTFAIYSLLSRYSNIMTRDPKTKGTIKLERFQSSDMKPSNRGIRDFLEHSNIAHGVLKGLAVLGVSLIMSDGVLTPAQSVLGAIQGLNVVVPDISSGTIIGVSCGILVLLFLVQPLGVSKLGNVFAPIIIIWLLFNFTFGIYNLAKHDVSVLKAFSPYFAGAYFVRNGTDGWKSLGGILLAFTGVEALFADLGAFSKRAIQLSWLAFVYPCLLLAYIGQAAFISDNPAAYSNPFYNSVPPGAFYPSLVISILAAVVASQAMITSTFQLLIQIMNLSYFPQIKVTHPSAQVHGQVFIPLANWLLMIGTVIVTAVYNNTTSLGNAYGVCVILVTFITTCMVTLVALIVWRTPSWLVFLIFIPFITLDGLYLSSALTKVPQGAWFTLLLAFILSSIFILWRYGKEQQWAAEAKDRLPPGRIVTKDTTGIERLHTAFGGGELTTIKGLGIFFDKAGDGVPTVYVQFLQKFEARPEVYVFLHMRALYVPVVPESEKYTVTTVQGIDNCYRITARHGYNEQIVTEDLGSRVYTQLRNYIVRSSNGFAPSQKPRAATINAGAGAGAGAGDLGESKPEPDNDNDNDADAAEVRSNFDPSSYPSLGLSGTNDGFTAASLQALDKAHSTQIVYLVGKAQLRILGPRSRSPNELVGTRAFRRVVLGVFLFLRENTRARVAAMRIPVEKLVEVGFVKDI